MNTPSFDAQALKDPEKTAAPDVSSRLSISLVRKKDSPANPVALSRSDIQQLVSKVMFSEGGVEDFQKKISELKADSLEQMESTMDIESAFNAKNVFYDLHIPAGSVDGDMTVEQVVDAIHAKCQQDS